MSGFDRPPGRPLRADLEAERVGYAEQPLDEPADLRAVPFVEVVAEVGRGKKTKIHAALIVPRFKRAKVSDHLIGKIYSPFFDIVVLDIKPVFRVAQNVVGIGYPNAVGAIAHGR